MANESAMQKINILKDTGARNLIFLGDEHKLMYDCARELASVWLETAVDELTYHPDYKEIGAENGSICSEQADTVQNLASYIPQSDKSVCIVSDAHTMTSDLQNKLLKVLEDGEKTIAVIFIASSPLLDTVTSRCITVEFHKTPIGEMATMPEYRKLPLLLACDGSPETYKRIEQDEWFTQYLEGFLTTFSHIKEREQLKNILQLTHALKEKDKEYLPDKLEAWQMKAFLCMLKKLFWHVMVSGYGMKVPVYIRLGNLTELYTVKEAEHIYRKIEEAEKKNMRKGNFTKNDFFELLMQMIPLD